MIWKRIAIAFIILEVITIIGGIQLSRRLFREEFRQRQEEWEQETQKQLEEQRAEHDEDLQFIAERFNVSLNSIQGELVSTQDALDAKQDELEQLVEIETFQYEYKRVEVPVSSEVEKIESLNNGVRVRSAERTFELTRLDEGAEVQKWNDQESSSTIEVAGTLGYKFMGFGDKCPENCDEEYIAVQFEVEGRVYRIRIIGRIEFADEDKEFLQDIKMKE